MTLTGKCLLATTAMLLLTAPALAQSSAPDATVSFSGGSLGAGVGYSWGNGVLHMGDRDYNFTVNGLSVADVGATKIDGAGEVYNLRDPSDPQGNYVAAGAGATLAGGGSVAVMQNEHGVIIHFHSTTQGLHLNAAVSGINIALKG